MKNIFVTGGNSGIGLALCTQLVEAGHRVFLGSRNKDRGIEAVKSIEHPNCSLVVIDVTSQSSVEAAATYVEQLLDGQMLYAIVNNAGIGLMHPGITRLDIIDVNLRGPKRVCDAFIPLLQPEGGRIANTSSGAASSYIAGTMRGNPMGTATAVHKKPLISSEVTWAQIEDVVSIEQEAGFAREGSGQQAGWSAYGLSKAALTAYAMLLAREYPKLVVSSCSPGFINTKMTQGFGATLQPEEGTVSLMHCLFNELGGNGWYFGSDGLRSPLHLMRNPGEPAYDGSPGLPGEPT